MGLGDSTKRGEREEKRREIKGDKGHTLGAWAGI